MDDLHGRHEVNRFATGLSTHCVRFYTLPASPGSDCINSLRQDWMTGNLHEILPFSTIPLVLHKIASDAATVSLILLVWQDQDWWPERLTVAKKSFLRPRSAGLFEPGRAHHRTPRQHWGAAVFRFLRCGSTLQTAGAPTSAP